MLPFPNNIKTPTTICLPFEFPVFDPISVCFSKFEVNWNSILPVVGNVMQRLDTFVFE